MATEQVCPDSDSPLADTDILYDPIAAQSCGCDIVDMSCLADDPFITIVSCMDMPTGPLGLGVQCSRDADCASDYCMIVDGCGGVCEEPKLAGELCLDDIFVGVPRRCEFGYFCDETLENPICAPLADLGEDCTERECKGDVDFFVFPTRQCDETANMLARK